MIRFELFEVGYGPFRGGAVPHAGSASFRVAIDPGAGGMLVPIGDVEIVFSRPEDSGFARIHQIKLSPAAGLSGSLLASALTSSPGTTEPIQALVVIAVGHWRASHNGGVPGEAVLRVG